MRHHPIKYYRRRTRKSNTPDLELLDGIVSDRMIAAAKSASKYLTRAKIRHALIGGLAIGAHGHPRATRDIDFLVGDEAFEVHGGGIVTINPKVPIMVDDIAVDPVSMNPGEDHLEASMEDSVLSGGIPILPIGPLVYLKLKANRPKDINDLLGLFESGIDTDEVEKYLELNAPELMDKYRRLKSEP